MTNICQIFRNNECQQKELSNGKLKISAFLDLKIKCTKNDKISNFLNSYFSVMGGAMDMIFREFWETTARLLKSIILQLFWKYRKIYNIKYQKLLKTQGHLIKRRIVLGPSNYISLIDLYESFLEWSWWSLWHLYFLRYYENLFPCQSF